MPESFLDLLSDIAQSASTSTNPAGADAARRRGHQRTVRKQMAAGVMAVALIGTSAGLALALAGNQGGAPKPITNSGTPTPNVSNTPAPPSTSPSPSNSPSSIPGTVTGDLNTIVPGAWTQQSRFPVYPGGWTANMAQPVIYTAERQWFYSCHAADTLTHLGAKGYQEITYKSSLASTRVDADQVLFFFSSPAAALQAIGTIQDDYANCPRHATSVHGVPLTVTLRQTEQFEDGYAWVLTYRTAQGQSDAPANADTDNHEFFVQRGNVVEMVRFAGDETIDQQDNDLTFLAALESNLCVYGGQCPEVKNPLSATITANGSTTLHLGGSAIQFTVTVSNNSSDTLRNIAPIVSLGHCTCSNTPTGMMPLGQLQLRDASTGAWKTVFYDAEGTGMDYLLSSSIVQVPAFDLNAGQSATFTFQLRLDPASANKLSGQYHLSNGTASINITLVHPVANAYNVQIGDSPTAALPVDIQIN